MSKLVSELQAEDFERSKVWAYRGDSESVATVEPLSHTELAEHDDHVYLASTEFRLADGTTLSGFSSPTDDSGLDYMQPVIFNNGSQLVLWSDSHGVENISEALGRELQDVYPIYWRSAVPVDGEVRTGFITL